MRDRLPLLALLTSCAATAIPAAPHQESDTATTPAAEEEAVAARSPRVQLFADGIAAHQLETALDGGGELAVTRAFVEPGLRYQVSPRVRLSLSVGAGRDDYDFGDGPSALAPSAPWDAVDGLRLGLGIRWFAGERWLVFAAPTVRWAAEEDADLSDGLFGGLIAAAAWRFSERLSLGPGFGVLSQIEDSPNVFPILAIRWQVAEDLVLETGRGLAATQGPGLTLAWTPAERWELLAGTRFDRSRFRLDDDGPAPGGVGEERGMSLFAAVTRGFWEDARVGLFGGVALGTSLTLEDAGGDELASADLDPAPFVGFLIQL